MTAHGLQKILGSHHVGEPKGFSWPPHLDLGGNVKNPITPGDGEIDDLRVGNIAPDALDAQGAEFRVVPALKGSNAVPAAEEATNDGAAEESSTTGHQGTHQPLRSCAVAH